ncbi:MAG: DUF1284 domain-containing protein [archaeon]
MNHPLNIRTHHLLCIPRFYRGGYDKEFEDNMKKICIQIRKDPNTKIKVIVGKPDNLCEKCPYLFEGRCVQSPKIGKWVTLIDKRVCKYLNLKPNSVHKAEDIFNLSIDKVNSKTIKRVCKDCIFLDNCIKVGMNKSFQRELIKKKKEK